MDGSNYVYDEISDELWYQNDQFPWDDDDDDTTDYFHYNPVCNVYFCSICL